VVERAGEPDLGELRGAVGGFVREPAPAGLAGDGHDVRRVALEEVGVLGTSLACLFSLPSIVGEALNVFGTPEQKARWLRPVLEGKLTVAEALTEPRGGSDFFGATTKAEDRGDHFLLNGQKRFIVGAEGADFFLVYARTNAEAKPQDALTCLIVERGPGVETKYLYGLMGCRGGGTGRLVFKTSGSRRKTWWGRSTGPTTSSTR
jgi:alkylation response protein AidB-like acyl-CoA dehydrogenase